MVLNFILAAILVAVIDAQCGYIVNFEFPSSHRHNSAYHKNWDTDGRVCIQRKRHGVFVGKMSCVKDIGPSGNDNNIWVDGGDTASVDLDTMDRWHITTDSWDALFIDSLEIYAAGDSDKGLEKCGSFSYRWGREGNYNGWCLSRDVNDEFDTVDHSTCRGTLLFNNDHQVYYYPSNSDFYHLCMRPNYGCDKSTDFYHTVDCDGDGFDDHACHSNDHDRRWLVLSSDGDCKGRTSTSWGSDQRSVDECSEAFNSWVFHTVINDNEYKNYDHGRRLEAEVDHLPAPVEVPDDELPDDEPVVINEAPFPSES